MMRTRAWSRGGLVAAVAMVLLAGCTSGGDADKDAGKTASDGDRRGSSTVEAAPLVDLTKTIGEPVEYQVPDSSGDTVTVGVLGLEVDDKIQIMHLVFTPNFASRSQNATVTLEDMLATWVYFDPELVDRTNLKIYSAVEHSGATATETTNGQPVYVYIVFAAPEDEDAVEFDLHIIDSWVPLKVRVEQK